jgi:hypothetical protein
MPARRSRSPAARARKSPPRVSCANVRRGHVTFLSAAEPPTWGEEWEEQSYREHIMGWTKLVGNGHAMPHAMYVMVVIKLVMHLSVFWYLVRRAEESIFTEQNFKRFLVYNVLGDVLGLNSTSGPLGFRFKYLFVTWYNLATPGTISRPLLPGVRAVRTWVQVLGYFVFLGTLVGALCAEQIGGREMVPIVGMLALLTPFDLVTFQACRGEHYGYMLVCLLFPWKQALIGCQHVQLALWFFAGLAKVGPWMKYVNAFMMPNGLALRFTNALGVLRYRDLFVDPPRDMAPSRLLHHLATIGVATELMLSPLAVLLPDYGVPLILAFHTYILSMLPFASVNEWNVSCIYFALFFFREGRVAHFPGDFLSIDPRLQSFLVLVLLIVPIVGQLFPKYVPFLLAYRPYAGNWRFTWHVIASKAHHKLRRLKTLEGVFVSEAASANPAFEDNPHMCAQLEDMATGNMVFFPHYRPLVPIVERLKKDNGWTDHQDCATFFQETFFNAVFGWCLGTGYYGGGAYFGALSSTCGFNAGECYFVCFEPHGLLDHTSEWFVVDVTKPDEKIIHGKCAYSELEKMQPWEMSGRMLDACSVLEPERKSKANKTA